jgi:hypothetical protein
VQFELLRKFTGKDIKVDAAVKIASSKLAGQPQTEDDGE